MLNELKKEANLTFTENGAVTLESTDSDCLDLFSSVGALRRESESDILRRFIPAYTENADVAMKILFYARDIRGGLGERKVFRTIIHWLAKNEPKSVIRNMDYIAEFGRFDDLLVMMDTPCEDVMFGVIRKQFEADMALLTEDKPVSLLGKWLPSINTSSADTRKKAKRVARELGLTDASYRKAVSALREKIRIIENNLREKDYSFDYSKQPSRAMFKYKKAFWRNDEKRYSKFLSAVATGKTKLNADNVCPYELIEPYLTFTWRKSESFLNEMTEQEKMTLNATWDSLTDFGTDENTLAVVDTSGSMYGGGKPLPAAVALSLGLYFAEHNKGIFKDHFIEFSARPQLIKIKGDTFVDRLRYVASFNEIANTDIEAVFDMILAAAVKNHLSKEEMVSRLILISDMEFDCCVDNASLTNFENAKAKYKEYGYDLPEIVFWNVASRNRQVPVSMNEQGVALISGATPRLFSMVAAGTMSPFRFMMEIIGSERYACIAA